MIIVEDGETRLTIIDFNMAVDQDKVLEICGETGVKQYSAPETRSSIQYTNKCDIWSYGCILYFMFAGKKPFELKID